MFFARRPVNPGPIMLLEPAEGGVTGPLQRFKLPSEEDQAVDDEADLDGQPPAVTWWDPRSVSADRSRPNLVTFRWMPPPRMTRSQRYDLVIDRDPSFVAPVVIRDLQRPFVHVRHLHVDTVYYWYVVGTVRGEPVTQSGVRSFRTHSDLPRWIEVPDITNVRDLGGWPANTGWRVRQGLVYRSSEMNNHLSLSDEGRDIVLHELGIRTDIDLRGYAEEPAPALPEDKVRWIHAPILPYEGVFGRDVMPALRDIFAVLADAASYPVVMHCWAGADRAGTLAMLLNGLLGVSLADLAADYELSSLSIWGKRSRSGADFEALLTTLTGPVERTPVDIREPVAEFLRRAGVTDDEIDAIRSHLLEPQPA